METRGRSRSKTPFTEVEEFAKEFIEKGSFTQKTVTRSTRSNTYRTEESSVRSNDEVTSVIDKPIRKSTRLEGSVRKVYKTSDYSSEDGETEATSTKIKSQNNKNQLIEDARAAANGNSEVSALDLYKKSGRYWDIYPKTDWTYSPHSKDRVELAPGVVAMPNMSRKTIHSVHSTDQTQVDYAHKETNTETLLRQRTSVFGEYQPKQLFNNNHEYEEHRKISYTYSQWQRIRRLLVTILTTVVTVSHFLFRVQTFFMAKVHKFTSRVMLLDTWLLWKNGRTTNKTTKLIALCVVPMLLLGGWYILTNLGSILYTFYFNSTSLATATSETTDSQINPIFIEPPNDKNNEELKPTPKIASIDYLEAISDPPPDLKGLDIENLVANIAQSSGFQEITRKLDSTTGSLAEELRKLKEQLEELDKQRLEDSLVIAQLKQQNNLNNFQLSKCCKRPVLDVSGYVKALLNDEGFLKSQKGFNEYLREAFAAKHELESQLGNLTARLSNRLDAAVDESSLRLMEEVSQRLTGSPQGVLSEEQVRRIVKNVLKVYDADKTGLVDYAMETMGGQVLSTRCTENYLYGKAVVSLLGVPLWYPINSPRTVITPSTNPGECWAFQNFPGFVVVRLSKRVQVEAVSLEHISRLLAPDGDISSAPKEVQVLGLRDEDDKQPVELGEFVYDVEGEPLQFFETRRVDQAFEIVELRIVPAETPFINTIWNIKDASEIILKTMIFLPVVLFGIFGNILVVFILAKNAHIRTPTNLLVGNMAAADLLSLLIHPWVTLVYDIFQNYQLGTVGCKGEATIECTVMIASVMSMSAITYDRLTAIVLPQETRLNKRGAKIVMVITWVFGCLLSIPISLYRIYRERQWLNFLEKYCTENLLIINIYWYVLITVLVWLPLTIQIICYISIFIKLNKYEKMIVKKFLNQQISYKKKAARMMFVVTLTFMICRVPFTALIIYRHQMIKVQKIGMTYDVTNQANGTYHSLWFTSKYLIFINAAINPLIYGVTNEKFLRAFKSTKLSKWMFPTTKKEIISKPIGQQKTGQDTTSKNTIFLIFKRKHKVADGPVPVTKKTNINTNL